MNQMPWHNKISNPAQLGGIETSILDNGAGRGSRIAWINTGTGLRYKIVLDRAMDIADTFFNQHSFAWISHLGITKPQLLSDKGFEWIKTFGGGLLVTCGLDHIGWPDKNEHEEHGLHGVISQLPAEIESIIQPNLLSGKLDMSITGTMKQTHPLGMQLELRRTISGRLGEAAIYIHDEVCNHGNTKAPHMLMYHFNFGWPLVDDGTEIKWQGKWYPREEGEKNKIFKEGNNFHQCPAPLEDHIGNGEEAVYVDMDQDSQGECICGLHNEKLGLSVNIIFQKNQLPWLTNWQHFGKGEYVTGLEPGTNRPIGQFAAKENNELIFLEPGEKRVYDIKLEVTGLSK